MYCRFSSASAKGTARRKTPCRVLCRYKQAPSPNIRGIYSEFRLSYLRNNLVIIMATTKVPVYSSNGQHLASILPSKQTPILTRDNYRPKVYNRRRPLSLSNYPPHPVHLHPRPHPHQHPLPVGLHSRRDCRRHILRGSVSGLGSDDVVVGHRGCKCVFCVEWGFHVLGLVC